MTFEEAVKFKSEVAEWFDYSGLKFKTYITPLDVNDLNKQKDDMRIYIMDDSSAKKYSLNNEFKVRGICILLDIGNVYHVDLPLK